MLKVEDLNKNQKDRYKKFINFYSDDMLETFTSIMDKYRSNTESQDYYVAYQSIIKATSSLMKELGVDNPLLTSVAFEYLLWNGYFSEDKELMYSLSNRVNNLIIQEQI